MEEGFRQLLLNVMHAVCKQRFIMFKKYLYPLQLAEMHENKEREESKSFIFILYQTNTLSIFSLNSINPENRKCIFLHLAFN